MSRSFGWVKCHPSSYSFDSPYSPGDMDKIIEVFGKQIGDTNILKLRHFGEATGLEIYTEIADLITKNGAIEIKIDY